MPAIFNKALDVGLNQSHIRAPAFTQMLEPRIQSLEYKPLLYVVIIIVGQRVGPARQVARVRFDGDWLRVGLAVYG
jgi:hypothetical protein